VNRVRYLFGPRGRKDLATLLSHNPVLGFDFDGTLAPLTEHPTRSALRPTTRKLLTRLTRLYRVVVISGRSRADLEPRFAGVPVAGIAGNHGIEPFGQTREVERLVEGWRRTLANDLSHLPGVMVEDKRYSLTVDYRHAPDMEATEAAIHRAARALPRVRLLGGRHADFNLAPAGAPNKGTALRRFVSRFRRHAALFVGDDRTDEDAFAVNHVRLLGVRIGRRRSSAARYFLREQREIDRLLAMILDEATNLGQ
jgi:trehalose 6-phosphate phosphatase